jgi:hypothetical protein
MYEKDIKDVIIENMNLHHENKDIVNQNEKLVELVNDLIEENCFRLCHKANIKEICSKKSCFINDFKQRLKEITK